MDENQLLSDGLFYGTDFSDLKDPMRDPPNDFRPRLNPPPPTNDALLDGTFQNMPVHPNLLQITGVSTKSVGVKANLNDSDSVSLKLDKTGANIAILFRR